MANRQRKRYSTSLIIREKQIKMMIRYHLTLVRMVTLKKSTNNKCWREYGENGTLLHCWWECKLVRPLWSTVLGVGGHLNLEWAGVVMKKWSCCQWVVLRGVGGGSEGSRNIPDLPQECCRFLSLFRSHSHKVKHKDTDKSLAPLNSHYCPDSGASFPWSK